MHEPVGVMQRKIVEHTRVFAVFEHPRQRVEVGEQGPARDHHGFRLRRGSRREHDVGGIVG